MSIELATTLERATRRETLTDLADRAVTEFHLAAGAALNALEHAIVCGDILLAAQALVPAGKWGDWCRKHVPEINFTTVTKFCRLAVHKDQLSDGEFTTIDKAMGYLRQIEIPRRPSGPMRRPRKLDVDEARKLHREGMNYVEIADVFGVSDTTVAIHLDPKRREKMRVREREAKRRRVAERAALTQQTRDRAVKASGGLPAEAYALLRRCALVLDDAIAKADDATERTKLGSALGFVYKAEDEIVRALRLERTSPRRNPSSSER